MFEHTHTIRRTFSHALAICGLIWVSTACDDKVDPPGPGPSTSKDASVAGDTGTPPGTDAGFADGSVHPDATVVPPPDDGNDTIAEADDIQFGTANRVMGAINPAGDRDFYQIDGNAGDWLSIFTSANPRSEPGLVDTVVRVYNPQMALIAQNDDAFPRVGPDSELMTRLPTTGRYYIEVLEFSDWAGNALEGSPTYVYQLAVLKLTPATNPYITEDAEAGDTAAGAPALGFLASTSGGILVGTFRDATDIDAFRFTITGAEVVNFSADVMPGGTEQNGSSNNPGRIWISNTDGSTVSAQINHNDSLVRVGPPTAPGDYLLWVEHAKTASGAGSNDFYVMKYRFGAENALHDTEPGNNSRAGADAIELTDNGTLRAGFLRSNIRDADVDYYSFDVMQGEAISVACGARSSGSGLVDLTVEVQDGVGASLMTGTETSTSPVFFEEVTTTSSGTHFLRVSKVAQSPVVHGDWVRCGIRAFVP